MWISNYSKSNLDGYNLIDKNGNPNLKRYKATFDYSLDLIKLREIYNKVYRNNRFSYIEKVNILEKEYCNKIINVTFEYSVKEFNRTGNNIYLKLGVSLNNISWSDCVGYYNGEIVAVRVNTPILDTSLTNELPNYFYYEDNQYKVKQNIKNVVTVADIRKKLYRDGFVSNGIKYVRWKRSSGSARVGKCLFIDETLYNRFHTWEMCGLTIRSGSKVDLAALESYISLTSSSIIDTLKILPQNILVIDDYDSVFTDDVINVTEQQGELCAKRENVEITNSIWDGMSLIDISLMGKYQDKGMLLLRNRFFKSCCFNTNIQKWFNDNKITSVSQLSGFTLAKEISEIKLITTPNSIKYLKFSTLEKWLSMLESSFGIVKYEKPPHFMNGKLVQTHYQLINSIQMTADEVKELLQPTFEFLTNVKKIPAVLKYWIKFNIENEVEVTPVKSKTDVIYKMMSVNEDFYKTKLYYDFKTDFLKSFSKDLKCGHVLVNGNYSTLCGNPIEMLQASIGRFNGKSLIEKECVFSKRFAWDKQLLGSRSPHPTISNVLLVKNKYNKIIDTYMNGTEEIVYINSINENILQQLAGCDFDSDSILLTDNDVLIRAAKRNNGKFKVAVCNVSGNKKPRRYTTEDQSDLDIKTSKNLIGDIINLAQELNTQIWDRLYKGEDYKNIEYLYFDTCKLSILSGIEIDKAKKEFIINSAKELSKIRSNNSFKKGSKSIKPNFFAHISKQKGYYNPEKKAYIRHNTSMDYLQQCVNVFRYDKTGRPQKNAFILFSDIIKKDNFDYTHVKDREIVKALDEIHTLNQSLSAIYSDCNLSKTEQHNLAVVTRQDFVEYIGTINFNPDTMIALLQNIEKDENKKIRRLLFYTLFGYPNTSFYDVIIQSKGEISIIKPCEGLSDIHIYDQFFTKTIQK